MTTHHSSTAPVVVAVDGTSASDGALRYAVQRAQAHGVGLRVLHVMPTVVPMPPLQPVEPLNLESHARSVLDKAVTQVRELAPNMSVSETLAQGGRVRAIVNGSADARLVVVGRETSQGLERLLTGATTAGVAANAQCPVVVVPADWRPRADGEGGATVVVGIRRPADASHVMAVAYEQAVRLGASITVVHAWEMPDPYVDRVESRSHAEEWRARGEQILYEGLGTWSDQYPHVSIDTQVVHGHPASVLVAAAKAADLVVVRRAHEHRPFDHLGATVRALLLASPAPVEVVPSRMGGSQT